MAQKQIEMEQRYEKKCKNRKKANADRTASMHN